MSKEHYTDMLEAISGLKAQGYVRDFNLAKDSIMCTRSRLSLYPDEFRIDAFYRFEDMSNPDDSSILYAISSSNGLKGILVNAYGIYAEDISLPMIRKFIQNKEGFALISNL